MLRPFEFYFIYLCFIYLIILYPSCAGLGRRSLLPSIPETILNSGDAADMAAKRAALLATISPEVCIRQR